MIYSIVNVNRMVIEFNKPPNQNSGIMTQTLVLWKQTVECLFVVISFLRIDESLKECQTKRHINKIWAYTNIETEEKKHNIYWCKHTVEQIGKRDDRETFSKTNRWPNNKQNDWNRRNTKEMTSEWQKYAAHQLYSMTVLRETL